MASKYDVIFSNEVNGIKVNGLFKQGAEALREGKPLLVFIHGGGTNASYFDNQYYSPAKDFSNLGYDILNINRAGYGGNPIPKSKNPLLDSIPVLISLIQKAYTQNPNGKNGIILIGHSLGALTTFAIAASKDSPLDILGVAALGLIPEKETPLALLNMPQQTGERITLEPTPEAIEQFMGPMEFLDVTMLEDAPAMAKIFEPLLASEIAEWTGQPEWYTRVTKEIMPGIKVPLQYLAAEYDMQWRGIEQGQPIFDEAVSFFTNAPSIDKGILMGGGHNFEFSKNSPVLHQRRLKFIEGLVR